MEGLNINNMDFMSFINSMNKMNKTDKKKKKAKKGIIKECKNPDDTESVAVNKDIDDCCEIKEETEEDSSDNSGEDTEVKKTKKQDKDSDEDEDDDDDEGPDLDILTNEKLYNMLNTFFVDEYGVTIATSMSNISYELHNLNKNLSKLLKSKK